MIRYDTPEKVIAYIKEHDIHSSTLWRKGKSVRYLHSVKTLRGDDLFVIYATSRSWKAPRKDGKLNVTGINVTEGIWDWFATATQVKYNSKLDIFEDMGDE
ncbi:hypothetical protein ACRHK7_01220 [Weissella tructae]|uniref:hypothetical protein n=1 Tax=Weissella tructae TaxID=887702 RepID=UPI003D8C6134